eukprot:911514-Prymnesium_polylepis.3
MISVPYALPSVHDHVPDDASRESPIHDPLPEALYALEASSMLCILASSCKRERVCIVREGAERRRRWWRRGRRAGLVDLIDTDRKVVGDQLSVGSRVRRPAVRADLNAATAASRRNKRRVWPVERHLVSARSRLRHVSRHCGGPNLLDDDERRLAFPVGCGAATGVRALGVCLRRVAVGRQITQAHIRTAEGVRLAAVIVPPLRRRADASVVLMDRRAHDNLVAVVL